MKRSDSGDFCVLYVEPDDEKSTLFQKVMEQKKPIVIMLAEQTRVFQRPEDFTELKHIRRHLDVPVLFVSPGSERLVHLAGRNGFPVYLSMDALVNALRMGQVGRQRGVVRKTIPLGSGQHDPLPAKTTGILNHAATRTEEATVPLLYETWGGYGHAEGGTGNRVSVSVSGSERRRSGCDEGGTGNRGSVYGSGGRGVMGADGRVMGPSGSLTRLSDPVMDVSGATHPSVDPIARRSSRSQTDIPTVPTIPLISAPPPPPGAQPRVNRLAAGVLVLLLITLITGGPGLLFGRIA